MIVVTVVSVDKSCVETTPCELSGVEHAEMIIDIKTHLSELKKLVLY